MMGRGRILYTVLLFAAAHINVIDIGKDNIDILSQTEVMLVNFYADWCRFSRQLHPIFVNTANVIREGIFSIYQGSGFRPDRVILYSIHSFKVVI